ncbi:MAG: plasmid recombination protein [Sulfurospirillaceae bacterium]|nr:plasmid recombination protein [Sulfurospirillaceae bacterium]MDY0202330.1 plasmid recombination protein [Tenuifilaceae bacterium]
MGKLGLSTQKIKNQEEYGNIRKHNFRQTKKENININLTHKNIVLYSNNLSFKELKEENKKDIQEQNKVFKTKYRNIRDDAAIGQSLVIQATKEHLNEQEHIQYLKDVNEHLKEYFKEFKIIDSVIHLDETTPHLHFRFCYFDKNKNKYNQKNTQEKCHLDNIENSLLPILKKYNIEKREKINEKIEKMEEKDKQQAQEILTTIKNKKDKKNALNKLLRKYNKTTGGEAYIQPQALKVMQKNNLKEVKNLHNNNIKKIFNNNSGFIKFDQQKAQTDILKYVLKVAKYNVITKNLTELKSSFNTIKNQFENTQEQNKALNNENYNLKNKLSELEPYKQKLEKQTNKNIELNNNLNNKMFLIQKLEEIKQKEREQQQKEQEREKGQQEQEKARQNQKNNYFIGR